MLFFRSRRSPARSIIPPPSQQQNRNKRKLVTRNIIACRSAKLYAIAFELATRTTSGCQRGRRGAGLASRCSKREEDQVVVVADSTTRSMKNHSLLSSPRAPSHRLACVCLQSKRGCKGSVVSVSRASLHKLSIDSNTLASQM